MVRETYSGPVGVFLGFFFYKVDKENTVKKIEISK